MTEESRKIAADALKDLGITSTSSSKGKVMDMPEAIKPGSTASLQQRREAQEKYLDSILNSNQATADQKKWLAGQLAEFGREFCD